LLTTSEKGYFNIEDVLVPNKCSKVGHFSS